MEVAEKMGVAVWCLPLNQLLAKNCRRACGVHRSAVPLVTFWNEVWYREMLRMNKNQDLCAVCLCVLWRARSLNSAFCSFLLCVMVPFRRRHTIRTQGHVVYVLSRRGKSRVIRGCTRGTRKQVLFVVLQECLVAGFDFFVAG